MAHPHSAIEKILMVLSIEKILGDLLPLLSKKIDDPPEAVAHYFQREYHREVDRYVSSRFHGILWQHFLDDSTRQLPLTMWYDPSPIPPSPSHNQRYLPSSYLPITWSREGYSLLPAEKLLEMASSIIREIYKKHETFLNSNFELVLKAPLHTSSNPTSATVPLKNFRNLYK